MIGDPSLHDPSSHDALWLSCFTLCSCVDFTQDASTIKATILYQNQQYLTTNQSCNLNVPGHAYLEVWAVRADQYHDALPPPSHTHASIGINDVLFVIASCQLLWKSCGR